MLASTLIIAGLATAAPLERRQSPSIPAGVPTFVLEFAPILQLFSAENYNPSDIGAQLANTRPYINLTAITSGFPDPLTLDNLDQLNTIPDSDNGKNIYLTSTSDPTTDPRPDYLYGTTPNPQGQTGNATTAAIITVTKNASTLDAFYFYFYAFNHGGDYLANRLNIGNHVGDWEHNTIRFTHGLPTEIWYSQHSAGQVLPYEASEKFQSTARPLAYVANGSHANYATLGDHDHTFPGTDLPGGLVEDHTDDAGDFWDPVLSAYFYSFDPESGTFTAYGDGAAVPVNWLYFMGKWGDDRIPESDGRQECFLGIEGLCKYTGGPTGPVGKDLGRKDVCPDGEECRRVSSVVLRSEAKDFRG